jgi:hypothetical protein
MHRSGMSARRFSKGLVAAGCVVGSVFGVLDLFLTWLDPVQDESPWALLLFYGPMFTSWAIAGFVVARHAGSVSSGMAGGMAIACATSVVFVVLNLVRVNLFLDQLVNRADWQNMMVRFKASGEALRLFVNFDYLRGAPFKIAVGIAIGALMGAVGSTVWWLVRGRRHELFR